MTAKDLFNKVFGLLPFNGKKTYLGSALLIAGLLLKPDVAVVTQVVELINSLTGQDLLVGGGALAGVGFTHKATKE